MMKKSAKTILMIGAFDTKGAEYAFLREQIISQGHSVLAVNTGVLGTTDLFPVEVEAEQVAQAGGGDLKVLREKKDRGQAMKIMSRGAPVVVRRLFEEGRFEGIIGMGGGGGTTMVTFGMRVLPVGFPKLCVSTVAAGDTFAYIGTKDIVMMPSIVDVEGINRISGMIFSRAAGAICGMVETTPPVDPQQKAVITATMFGNTTVCVDACVDALTAQGYEVLVFHATGVGGQTMESLVNEGLVDGVLDITTTEWADNLCEGIYAAGPERLRAPGKMGIPHLIVPGCVDMVNYGPPDSIPRKYKDANRNFYEWNPTNTLMRTNVEENRQMGKIFAERANVAGGPVAFLVPLRGVSILDGEGQPFCDRQADKAMFDALKENLKQGIPVIEMDNNINDPEFSAKAVEMMMELIANK
ncbi:MAG: Tm-1-like ATP-binding domain-containing protein [Planctomycetota bacterium]|jgi:uncharacterized protein (UPF0261 family)